MQGAFSACHLLSELCIAPFHREQQLRGHLSESLKQSGRSMLQREFANMRPRTEMTASSISCAFGMMLNAKGNLKDLVLEGQ